MPGSTRPDGNGIGVDSGAGVAVGAAWLGAASAGGVGGGVAAIVGEFEAAPPATIAASPASRTAVAEGKAVFTSGDLWRFGGVPFSGERKPSCRPWYNAGVVKQKIHPKWYPEARVHCACGSTFTTGSTLPEIGVEICAACHPLFTGQQKLVDTAGRVDKFNQRAAAAKKKQEEAAARRARRNARNAAAQA